MKLSNNIKVLIVVDFWLLLLVVSNLMFEVALEEMQGTCHVIGIILYSLLIAINVTAFIYRISKYSKEDFQINMN